MNKNMKKVVAGGVIGLSLYFPTSLYRNQLKVNADINKTLTDQQEGFKVQLEQKENEIESLLKQLEQQGQENQNLINMNKALEQENQSLEGVQQSIINNVGYMPNEWERGLLERLVECEAGAESMTGKIAVANVVLNRIKSDKFPNSISKVIYEKNQFEPVVTGVIDRKTPSTESKEAVKRALLGERVIGSDILNFWASWLDKNNDIWKHIDIVTTIGVHHFGREWI